MTDSNRVRVAAVKEVTLGTTPATPRMRTTRDTGEGLSWSPDFFTSAERRSDRMRADPAKINETNGGTLNWEQSYPAALSAQSALLESAMLSTWTETPGRDNDGTADSVITDIGTTANTLTCTTGAAFVIGHLVQTTGFTTAANNTVARVTTGGATSYVATAGGYVAEAVPPAAARAKVVGCAGIAGDIVATATGLTCTALSFTGVGIVVGMWIKIGGTAAGDRFATAACNGWARVTAVSATAITLDNRPAGWTTDTGATKTIKLWFGDVIRNGTTLLGLSIERGFLAQTTPTYIVHKGMCVDQLTTDITTEQGVTGTFTFMGMSASESTSALSGATYASAPTGTVMTANASVGEVRIGGSLSASPNWVRSVKLNLANNLRRKTAVGTVGAVDIGTGQNSVTGSVETYFGSDALLAAAMAGTVSSLSARATANSQALIQTLPRITMTSAAANASAINSDVLLSMDFEASIDSTTNCQIQYDRVEYFEA